MNEFSQHEGVKYNAIFRASVDGIITISRRGVIESLNPAASELFGYQTEEVKGKNVKILMPEPYQREHDGYLNNYRKTKKKKIIGIGREVEGLRKDGTIFPFRLAVCEVIIEEKTIFAGFIHDLSKQKNAEQELLELNKELKSKVNKRTENLVLEIGEAQDLNRDLNEDIEERKLAKIKAKERTENLVLEIEEAQDINRHLNEDIGDLNEDIEERKLAKIKAKERTEDLVLEIEEAQDLNRHLNEDIGDLNEDIEERKLATIKAKELLDKEVELGELKSRFVSMASHEFRTPLTSILSSITLISKYSLPEQEEKKQKHIERIQISVENLTSILNDFLSIDKLQAGKIECNPFMFNYQSLLNELIDEMNEMKKLGQEIVFKHEGDESFYTDPNILKNILLNLSSNAIKYTQEGKTIHLISKLNKGKLSIEIKDEGIGIPKEEQKHLFERFFRAKNVLHVQGTGLGLHIVKEYVHLLSGKLSFESIENKGSTFSVVLPTYQEES